MRMDAQGQGAGLGLAGDAAAAGQPVHGRPWAWPTGALVLASLAGAVGWYAMQGGPQAAQAQAPASTPVAVEAPASAGAPLQLDAASAKAVRTVRVRQGAWSALRLLAGEVQSPPEVQAVVSAPWVGRVVAIPVREGQQVQAGQVLVELASAELGQAEAAFLKAIAQQRLAQRELGRTRRLFQDELASRREVEEAEWRLQGAQVEVDASREALRGLGLGPSELGALAQGGRVRGRQALRAPIAGTVVGRPALLGQAVGPQDAQPLVALAQLGTAWVAVRVPELDLAGLQPGAPAEVDFVALGGRGLDGRVARLAPTVEPSSRALTAWVALPNPGGRLKPGLSAQVRLRLSPRQALVVPASAVLREPGGHYAYKALGGGRFEERRVEVGELGPEGLELRSGLAAGDEVVSEGAFDLRSLAKGVGAEE